MLSTINYYLYFIHLLMALMDMKYYLYFINFIRMDFIPKLYLENCNYFSYFCINFYIYLMGLSNLLVLNNILVIKWDEFSYFNIVHLNLLNHYLLIFYFKKRFIINYMHFLWFYC